MLQRRVVARLCRERLICRRLVPQWRAALWRRPLCSANTPPCGSDAQQPRDTTDAGAASPDAAVVLYHSDTPTPVKAVAVALSLQALATLPVAAFLTYHDVAGVRNLVCAAHTHTHTHTHTLFLSHTRAAVFMAGMESGCHACDTWPYVGELGTGHVCHATSRCWIGVDPQWPRRLSALGLHDLSQRASKHLSKMVGWCGVCEADFLLCDGEGTTPTGQEMVTFVEMGMFKRRRTTVPRSGKCAAAILPMLPMLPYMCSSYYLCCYCVRVFIFFWGGGGGALVPNVTAWNARV